MTTAAVFVCLFAVGIGYLIGSLDGALIFGKLFYGVDVRDYGSGNAGTTNVVRVLGWRAGLITLALDVIKGSAAVLAGMLLARIYGEDAEAFCRLFGACTGLGAVIGHDWPLYFQFRGGKGVAVTVGAALALTPWPGVIIACVAIAIIAVTRLVSLGSLTAFVILPFLIRGFYPGVDVLLIWAVVVSLMGIIAHRQNIGRLIKRKENKLTFSQKPPMIQKNMVTKGNTDHDG